MTGIGIIEFYIIYAGDFVYLYSLGVLICSTGSIFLLIGTESPFLISDPIPTRPV